MLLEKFKTAKQPEIQALRQLEYTVSYTHLTLPTNSYV